jgi:hypothetical protein
MRPFFLGTSWEKSSSEDNSTSTWRKGASPAFPRFHPAFPLLFSLARLLFAPRLDLMAEILALRQHLNRTAKRPSMRFQDRLFWIALSRFWRDWRSALLIVKPETVIKCHRQGFRLYWRWKSKAGRPGRPRIDPEIRELICRLSRENPLWGTRRIKAELHLLGFEVAEPTVGTGIRSTETIFGNG